MELGNVWGRRRKRRKRRKIWELKDHKTGRILPKFLENQDMGLPKL